MSQLYTENLSAGYDNKSVVDLINLKISNGRIITLIGPNGAGKSTILKTVSGALNPVGGNVYIDRDDIYRMKNSDRAKNISVMLTGRTATEYMSCFDVVSVGRYQFTGIMGRLSENDINQIENALELVGAGELKNRDFTELSDGQKQRILLARALVQEPKFLILDEPTSYLDIGYKLEFIELIKKLSETKNIGVLMSLHEIELVGLISDEIICIDEEGRIDRTGSSREILDKDYIKKLFKVKSNELYEIYSSGIKAKDGKNTSDIKEPELCKSRSDTVQHKFGNTKFLMVQGTMSSAGKSLITAGLLRLFKQDGYRVAPFKSQNMALNSYVTDDGLEMGRAQVMQAEAAGIAPSVYMNPILLKPTSDVGSQVIVNGRVVGNMKAREYFEYKKSLIPEIETALSELCSQYDIIVIEGAGSPAEINLKQNDIVNMGMAEIADAKVILVGDIDRGGVFAQLYGTMELLEESERKRIAGFVVNKFRGDKSILDPGVLEIEKRCNTKVVGVVPYVNLSLDDEDSLTERFNEVREGLINIAVIQLPHISNFTDFYAFDEVAEVGVRYVTQISRLEGADFIIIPGTKNTIADMKWLKETGLATAIERYASKGVPVLGICGGYQMLGKSISDPQGIECRGDIDGLGLLDVCTVITEQKERRLTSGNFDAPTGVLGNLKDVAYKGYEIHMGKTEPVEDSSNVSKFTGNGTGYCKDNIYGTYIHGIFDEGGVLQELVRTLAKHKKVSIDVEKLENYREYKDREYDKLADILRQHMDIEYIYNAIGVK